MKKKAELLPSLDVVLSETKSALERQFEQSSSLDMKLGVSVGLSGVILAALLGFPLIRNGDMATRWLLIAAAASVLVALLLAAVGGFWIRKFEWAPRPEALREFYLTSQSKVTKIAIIDTQISAYRWNRKRIVLKAQFMHFSFAFVFLGAFIIGVTILCSLL